MSSVQSYTNNDAIVSQINEWFGKNGKLPADTEETGISIRDKELVDLDGDGLRNDVACVVDISCKIVGKGFFGERKDLKGTFAVVLHNDGNKIATQILAVESGARASAADFSPLVYDNCDDMGCDEVLPTYDITAGRFDANVAGAQVYIDRNTDGKTETFVHALGADTVM